MAAVSELERQEGSLEAVYQSYSINDRALGHGEPIRVRQGQKVLFRILNASATLGHRIALAGHEFMSRASTGILCPCLAPSTSFRLVRLSVSMPW
jgi:hypothetical protein